ncbi:flagellar brake protein [Sporolactobacillus spathodeae]|uniref:C-di-GMP-binding flagellar brake protein YcgR n=1 Tax=Sporolactobacillus spathodeae TaxID=1465502 RepID=A0ABS2Q7Q0_9BACL|nr:flagellar brake domain-containing protein [Sporolactobacillus spathodeae]MBM7657818.1 c-di-GMP-binding flagellar brake protein YcgR [Sporolactobacillus spathodeae]
MIFNAGETLRLKSIDADGIEHLYRCRLAEVYENELIVDYPIDEKTDKTVVLMNQTPFEASYVDGRHVYSFHAVFERRVQQGKIPLLLISYGGEEAVRKVQRRNFVRVVTNQNIAIHSSVGKFAPFNTVTSDIGGGGALILLSASHDLAADEPVDLWLSLVSTESETRYLKIKGMITRIFTDHKTNHLKASLRFLFDSERDRQPVIRFCFEKQLEERRKMFGNVRPRDRQR